MQISAGKVLSLAMAAGYVFLAVHWGGVSYWRWAAGLLLPLAFIWFPEQIGNLTGYYKSGYVNVQTPAAIVSFLGWVLLIAPAVVFILFKR